MKKFTNIIVLLFSASFLSCSDWFDINPKTEISEKEHFSTTRGFYTSVTGLYTLALNESLYGRELSYRFIELVANQYSVSTVEHEYMQSHNYEAKEIKSTVTKLWGNLYNIVVNCNSILANLEPSTLSFAPGNREIVEATALGFRGMIHFDLLRLFGPSPATGLKALAIPYADKIQTTPFKQLTTEEVLNKCIADLTRAYDLLIVHDPILNDKEETSYMIDNGFRNNPASKLNYMVVTSLLSRVYLYKGDLKNAYHYAILSYNQKIPWSISNEAWFRDATGYLIKPVSITEEEIKRYFGPADYGVSSLVIEEVNRKEIYEVTKYQSIDNRQSYDYITFDSNSSFYSLYKKMAKGVARYAFIKRSEILLILAETAASNNDDPYKYINELRSERGLGTYPLTAENCILNDEITMEYRKDFIGEGQLFYYYKRLNFSSFRTNNGRIIDSRQGAIYKLPLPEEELSFGDIQ